jgi:rubredoxin
MQRNNSTKKRYESIEQPDSCPACGSNRIARIVYGLPSSSPRLMERVEKGEIVFGGCCITRDDPSWNCPDCNAKIYRHK